MTIQHFTTSDGLRLAFDDRDSGLPLLCLAGLTRNMADFEPILEPLAGRCRLIRLDSRGRGLSQYDANWSNYTIARESADALELLDHLGLPRVAILGTSRGGLLAMALAATHRARLMGVFLNDIGPEIDPRGLARIMDYVGLRPPYPDYEAAATGLAQGFAAGFPGVPPAIWRAAAERMWRESPAGLDLRYDANLRRTLLETPATAAPPDLWQQFDALHDLPVSVLRGENSDILTAATVAEMRRRHPGLQETVARDRGHTPFLDEPDSLAALRDFLARLAPPPPRGA